MRSLFRNPILRNPLPSSRVTLPISRCRSFSRTLAAPSTAGYGDIGQTGESSQLGHAGSRSRNNTEHPGREPVEKHGRGKKGHGEAVSNEGKGKSGGENWLDMDMGEPNGGNKEDVEKHNREMERRYDHKQGTDETVGKGFWSGQGGRDRDP